MVNREMAQKYIINDKCNLIIDENIKMIYLKIGIEKFPELILIDKAKVKYSNIINKNFISETVLI